MHIIIINIIEYDSTLYVYRDGTKKMAANTNIDKRVYQNSHNISLKVSNMYGNVY